MSLPPEAPCSQEITVCLDVDMTQIHDIFVNL